MQDLRHSPGIGLRCHCRQALGGVGPNPDDEGRGEQIQSLPKTLFTELSHRRLVLGRQLIGREVGAAFTHPNQRTKIQNEVLIEKNFGAPKAGRK